MRYLTKNKKTIKGIKLGKDYLDLGEYTTKKFGTFHAYSPLSQEGAIVLAGSQVLPAQKNRNTANWDIASVTEWGTAWERYALQENKYFIILCGENIPTFKVCFEVPCYYDEIKDIKVLDYFGKSTELDVFFKEQGCPKSEKNTIFDLIDYAFEEGAYDKRDGMSSLEEEDDLPSIEDMAEILGESLQTYFNNKFDVLVDNFGEDTISKVIEDYVEELKENPLDNLEETLGVIYEDWRHNDPFTLKEAERIMKEEIDDYISLIEDSLKELKLKKRKRRFY